MFLPVGAMDLDFVGDEVRPRYLGSADLVWIEVLMEEYDRHVGMPRRLLDERLSGPLPAYVPGRRAKAVRAVLDRIYETRLISPVSPQALRRAVFEAASVGPRSGAHDQWRASVLRRVGAEFGLTLSEVERCLYADVPSEKILTAPREPVSARDLVSRANLLVAQSLLFRSHRVLVEAEVGLKVVVRTAKMLGLICHLSRGPDGDPIHPFRRGSRLEISGPLSILGRTTKYGRALARLLPVLVWAPRWTLGARLHLSGGAVWFRASHHDGLSSGNARPKRFDSKLEERFLRDFGKLAPDWDILREPEPVPVDDGFVFPDFGLVWTGAPRSRVLVELVGFWTPVYLERKARRLRLASLGRCILCVDESLGPRDVSFRDFEHVLFFRRKVDAAAVLARARALLGIPVQGAS